MLTKYCNKIVINWCSLFSELMIITKETSDDCYTNYWSSSIM